MLMLRFENVAKSLKQQLLYVDSATNAVELAKEIRELGIRNEGNSSAVLNLIEPWNTDDETSSVLISHLFDGNEGDVLDWPSQILCSVILPKFLALHEPLARVLMDPTIEYCQYRLHELPSALFLHTQSKRLMYYDPMSAPSEIVE